jgi:hypothetical protein
MSRDFALIIGGTSFIAGQVLPFLDLNVTKTYFISRNSRLETYPRIKGIGEIIKISQFNQEQINHIISEINLTKKSSLLLINFTGTLGNLVENGIENVSEFYETFSANLDPFLHSINIFSQAGPKSLFITFSGAGVGGDSFDDSSLGYLCAKTSMAILVESFQEKFSSQDKFICSIAPGPFPSQMQKSILDTRLIHKISASRIEAAKRIVSEGGSPNKLINVLNYAISNPKNFGGRIISANYDAYERLEISESFGKLRRSLE